MKRLTPTAWRRVLTAYEAQVLNPAMPHLTDEERAVLFRAHDVLRLRAVAEPEAHAVPPIPEIGL